jgi:CheY-like chemotaxis protein
VKKILLIDDTVQILEELKDILEMENYEIVTSSSAEEGLSQIVLEIPDLIITDIQMSGISGLELVRNLRSYDGYKDIPVLILTANVSRANVKEAKSLNMQGFLKKPCSIEELLNMVDRAIN